jgi:hypothetical protein
MKHNLNTIITNFNKNKNSVMIQISNKLNTYYKHDKILYSPIKTHDKILVTFTHVCNISRLILLLK